MSKMTRRPIAIPTHITPHPIRRRAGRTPEVAVAAGRCDQFAIGTVGACAGAVTEGTRAEPLVAAFGVRYERGPAWRLREA
jgi:hypothetical protein